MVRIAVVGVFVAPAVICSVVIAVVVGIVVVAIGNGFTTNHGNKTTGLILMLKHASI